MKKRLVLARTSLLLLTLCSFSFAQRYPFVPQSYIEVDKWKYTELLSKTPKPEIDYRLESGKNYTSAYVDSIQKSKDAYRLGAVYLSDSIANKVMVILKMRSDDEIKQTNEAFYKFQKEAKHNRKKLMGSIAPGFKLTDILGREYASQDMAGKMVFLNFWFTKCAPCIAEMPDLNKLKEKYGSEKILYFAVTYDKIEWVERFLNKQRLDFTVIPDDRKTIDAFGVSYYPTNILIDQKGTILYVSEFFNPKSHNGLVEIEKLLKKHLKKD